MLKTATIPEVLAYGVSAARTVDHSATRVAGMLSTLLLSKSEHSPERRAVEEALEKEW
ncbi:MAG: hypothetical protein AAF663_00025 [Planctomycetota bacterium]